LKKFELVAVAVCLVHISSPHSNLHPMKLSVLGTGESLYCIPAGNFLYVASGRCHKTVK
jgi:hypothetical protein